MAGPGPLPLLLLFLYCACARAGALIELSAGAIDGPGFGARQVQLRLEPVEGHRTRLVLTAHAVEAGGEALHAVELRCRELVLEGPIRRCNDASMRLTSRRYGPVEATGEVHYEVAGGALEFSLPELRSGAGRVALAGRWRRGSWRLRAELPALDLKALAPLAADRLAMEALTGSFSGTLSLSGEGGALRDAGMEGRFRDVAFNGRNVAEALAARVRAGLGLTPAGVEGSLDLRLEGGALYLEPGFTVGGIAPGFTLEPVGAGITLHAEGGWQRQGQRLELRRFLLDDASTGRIEGHLDLSLGPVPVLHLLELESGRLALPPLYRNYLQPLLLDTPFGDLEVAGSAGGKLRWRDGRLRVLDLVPSGVHLQDRAGRFALAGLEGEAHLDESGPAPPSRLRWEGFSLYRLDFGAAQLPFQAIPGGVRLERPVRIPLFDGALRLQSLKADGLFSPAFSLETDALLEPLSLQELCHALGWPVFPGTLAGEVPGLRYAQGELTIAGILLARAFDGRIEIRGLRVRGLFDPVPELTADIRFHDLDLKQLTGTFSFGEIEGRLDGAIRDLRLQAWEPVSFDAWFATPEDYRGRRRISQKAVENLTRIGGGMSANLVSRELLGLFRTFSYDRIGIRCRLRRGVCEMDGVMPAPKGYYILRHGLLPPWIDIIGYNREVDWALLVDRLRAIARGSGPVIR